MRAYESTINPPLPVYTSMECVPMLLTQPWTVSWPTTTVMDNRGLSLSDHDKLVLHHLQKKFEGDGKKKWTHLVRRASDFYHKKWAMGDKAQEKIKNVFRESAKVRMGWDKVKEGAKTVFFQLQFPARVREEGRGRGMGLGQGGQERVLRGWAFSLEGCWARGLFWRQL